MGLQERRHIQELIANNPGILDEDLLIITKEFSDFDKTKERLDLLAVDKDGKLVVIELKRDDTGADVHWQAIKYASYLHQAEADEIIRMLAAYKGISEEEAKQSLLDHLDQDSLSALNNDQRIILASHRFAPEVTSAVLWLNEKARGEVLITCIQLTPYQDSQTGTLYIQTNTIIPVPGAEKYSIQIGSTQGEGDGSSSSVTVRNNNPLRNDNVTRFAKKVAGLAMDRLPDDIKPKSKSQFAHNYGHRSYWLSYLPSTGINLYYEIGINPSKDNQFCTDAFVAIWYNIHDVALINTLEKLDIQKNQRHDRETGKEGRIRVDYGKNELNDDFAKTLAETLRHFIKVVTPKVDAFVNERNEEDA